jgi:hypothetical protein
VRGLRQPLPDLEIRFAVQVGRFHVTHGLEGDSHASEAEYEAKCETRDERERERERERTTRDCGMTINLCRWPFQRTSGSLDDKRMRSAGKY